MTILRRQSAQTITVKAAATQLGIRPDTFRRAIDAGRLPGIRIAHGYYIPVRAWERFLAGEWTPNPQPEPETPLGPVIPLNSHKRRQRA